MTHFRHFQSQAENTSKESKFSGGSLSLSGLMEYVDSAQKQSFDSLCGLQPLVKSYQGQVQKTSQAMIEAEALFQEGEEIPTEYLDALKLVKQGFTNHLGSLQEWMEALSQKDQANTEQAISKVKESGKQLESSLMGLSTPQ